MAAQPLNEDGTASEHVAAKPTGVDGQTLRRPGSLGVASSSNSSPKRSSASCLAERLRAIVEEYQALQDSNPNEPL